MVEACAEYLKALEVMEGRFEEKELVGRKAAFMFYLYNRLLELFSAQFMMDPALICGEKALAFCQNEPSLPPKDILNTLYHIGKQYDKKGEKNIARRYYGQAVEGISDINSMEYRDVITTKALSDYQAGQRAEISLNALREALDYASNEKERLTRFLTIGAIFTLEQSFDSALYYLEPVFENQDNVSLRIQAADYLVVNYDNIGEKAKSEECMRFLAKHKKSEGESKALTSQLENMFKTYQSQKQEKEAEVEREKSIRKTICIIVPIAFAIALAIIVMAKRRSRKLLQQQQEDADRVLDETEQAHEEELRWLQAETKQRLEEAEKKHQQKVEDMMQRHEVELRIQKDQSEKEIEQTRQRHEAELEAERLTYQKEREGLQLSLQLSKRNVNTLQEELGRKRTNAEGHYEAFLKESVCVKINDAVRDLQITTRKPYTDYSVNFDDETLAQFGLVVSSYYGAVKPALQCLYPSIAQEDLLLCYLYLLGMENKQIAVVRHREYSTVRKQAGELKKRLGIEESVRDYVLRVAGVEEYVDE